MTRRLRFTKMQGLGNDFVVLDGVRERVALTPAEVRRIADRHFGVGCDQVLLRRESNARRCRSFATGYSMPMVQRSSSVVTVRAASCTSSATTALTSKRVIRVETRGGVIEPTLEAGWPGDRRHGPTPVRAGRDPLCERQATRWWQPLDVGWRAPWAITAVSMGNPHVVQVVADVEAAPVPSEGPQIECHERFPQGTNAGYMQVIDRANIRLRVWERGVGETLACGTGACAAAVTGIRRGLVTSPVNVATRGGPLRIAWAGCGAPVMMTGPAETVFEGEWPVSG